MPSNSDHEHIFPSRANYVFLASRVMGARKGLSLLKKKQDALDITIRKLKAENEKNYANSLPKLKEAYIALSYCKFNNADLMVLIADEPKRACAYLGLITAKHVGISVPMLHLKLLDKTTFPFIGLGRGGESVQETRIKFQTALSQLISMATLEYAMSILEEARQKNNMRSNGIEYVILPLLKNTQEYIGNELEEIDRENFYRLKCSRATQKIKRDEYAKSICKNDEHMKTFNYGTDNLFDMDDFSENRPEPRLTLPARASLPPLSMPPLSLPQTKKRTSEVVTERQKGDPLWDFWSYSSTYLLQVPQVSEAEPKKRRVRRRKNKRNEQSVMVQTEPDDFF